MSKKLRPSLKDYLKTGEVRLETLPDFYSPPSEPPAPEPSTPKPPASKPSAPKPTVPKPSAPEPPASKPALSAENAGADEKIRAFLELLSEADRRTWEPALRSGAEIRRPAFDAAALREDFRLMDRTRFTYYILSERNAPLRVVRTSVQIREPFALLFKWDETGEIDIYGLS